MAIDVTLYTTHSIHHYSSLERRRHRPRRSSKTAFHLAISLLQHGLRQTIAPFSRTSHFSDKRMKTTACSRILILLGLPLPLSALVRFFRFCVTTIMPMVLLLHHNDTRIIERERQRERESQEVEGKWSIDRNVFALSLCVCKSVMCMHFIISYIGGCRNSLHIFQ